MTEAKPYADRLKDEVDAFFRLWKEKRWIAVVFLVILIGTTSYSLVAWFQRGDTINDLRTVNRDQKIEISDLRRDLRSLESENKGLRETVAPLIVRAAREFPGEEINDSLKKVVGMLDQVDPRSKSLAAASAEVSVVVASEKPITGYNVMYGAQVNFGMAGTSLLTLASRDSYAQQVSSNQVVYRATLSTIGGGAIAHGGPLSRLSDLDHIQIRFDWIPKGSRVLGGSLACAFNGAISAKSTIPSQQMPSDIIVVGDVRTIQEALRGQSMGQAPIKAPEDTARKLADPQR